MRRSCNRTNLSKFYSKLILENTVEFDLIKECVEESLTTTLMNDIIRVLQHLQYYKSVDKILNKFIEEILTIHTSTRISLINKIISNFRTYKPSQKVLKLCLKSNSNHQFANYLLFKIYNKPKFPVNQTELELELRYPKIVRFAKNVPLLYIMNKYILDDYRIIATAKPDFVFIYDENFSTEISNGAINQMKLLFSFKASKIRQDMKEFTDQISKVIQDIQSKPILSSIETPKEIIDNILTEGLKSR